MSGLFTAAFLRQVGWDIDVFERSSVELVGRGAGITTHPELLEALERSGAGLRDLGVEVDKRITLDRHGKIIAEKRLPQILTSWDRLQRLMRETIDARHYHLGHSFERLEQDGSGVVAYFGGGRRERADLLVGADGIRSTVRGQIAPAVQPVYSGYFIWRGAPKESDLHPHTRESIFPYFTFYLPEQQQVIGYPIAGLNNDLRPGHRRYNFIWYRVGDAEALRRMCVDESGEQHAYSVPPPLIRKDLIERMRADAEEIMPSQFLDCLRNTRPFFTPIYDFSTPQLVFGRVALVGDAASSARPHMGFGMAKAGGDAQALAQALGYNDDIDSGLDALQPHPSADRRAHHAARAQIGNPSRRELANGRRSRDVALVAGSPGHDGLDRGAQLSGGLVARMSGAPSMHCSRLVRKRAAKSGDTRMSLSGRAFGATPLAHAGYGLHVTPSTQP